MGITPAERGRAAGWEHHALPPSVENMTTPAPALPVRRSWFAQLGVDTAFVVAGFPLARRGVRLVITGCRWASACWRCSSWESLCSWNPLPGPGLRRGGARQARPGAAPGPRRRPVSPGSAGRGLGAAARHAHGRRAVLARRPAHAGALPIAVAGFSIVVTWWASALGGLTYGLWDWTLPHDVRDQGVIVANDRGLPAVLGIENTATNRIVIYTLIGLIFAVTLPFVVRLCALVEAWVAHGMLNGVARLRDDVAVSHAQTVAAVSAEATALRRLERDIHDGPQQRLVRLAMDLGRAQQQLDERPRRRPAATVDEALTQAREALDELRALSRGIAPPMLADRGLAAALAALAARVHRARRADVDLPERPAGRAGRRDSRLLRGGRGADQRRQAQRRQPAPGVGVAAGRRRLLSRSTDDGAGRRRTRQGPRPGRTRRPAARGGGTADVTSPPGGPTTVRPRGELPSPGHSPTPAPTARSAPTGSPPWDRGRRRRGAAARGPGPPARPRPATRWWPPSATARAASRRCSSTGPTCRSWTYGCRRPTPTRGCARRSTCAPQRAAAARCWCCPSTSRSSYADDLLRRRAGRRSATCSRTGSPTSTSSSTRCDRVAGGGTVLDPEVVAQLLAGARRDDPLDALTPREREVLALMAEGRSNAAIAARARGQRAARWRSTSATSSPSSACRRTTTNRRVLAVLAYLRAPTG